jgi:hypothetical protein
MTRHRWCHPAELMARNVPTPSGGRWHAATVLRALDRLPTSG